MWSLPPRPSPCHLRSAVLCSRRRLLAVYPLPFRPLWAVQLPLFRVPFRLPRAVELPPRRLPVVRLPFFRLVAVAALRPAEVVARRLAVEALLSIRPASHLQGSKIELSRPQVFSPKILAQAFLRTPDRGRASGRAAIRVSGAILRPVRLVDLEDRAEIGPHDA